MIEPLETRALLSGWITADTLPPPTTGSATVNSVAADSAGNIYAAGSYGGQGLLRVKAAGAAAFATVATPPAGGFASVFADPQGNVFLAGQTLLERSAGQQNFAPVAVSIPGGARYGIPGSHPFASDSAGNVFAVGLVSVPTGTTTSHGQTTTTYSDLGTIFELKAGQTSFAPAYQESHSTFIPSGITVIPTGPSAGLYVMDGAPSNMIVRKSTDGGATWSKITLGVTVDSYDGGFIASDPAGNGQLYVAGTGVNRVLTGYTYTKVKGQIVQTPVYTNVSHCVTQTSSDGGATWTVVDDMTSVAGWIYDIAALNGTVYVAAYGSDGIVRSNTGGTWQTVDDTGGSVYQTVTVDPVTAAPYAGGVLTISGTSAGWSVRSGPASTPPAVTTAMATFSTSTVQGSSRQSNSASTTISDDSRLAHRLLKSRIRHI